jgi:membrane protein EpsK
MALSKGEISSANLSFNTVFWGIFLGGLILLLCGIAISFSSPLIFNIPLNHTQDVIIVFLSVSVAFTLTALTHPFMMSTFAKNRLDIRSLTETLLYIFRVGVTSYFIIFINWRLGAVSLGIILTSMLGLILSYFLWKKLTPELSLTKQSINFPLFKEITGMGTWLLIDQMGQLLLFQAELIIINKLYGPNLTGRYGAILLIPTMLRSISGVLATNLLPPIFNFYAKKEMDKVFEFTCRSIKFGGLLLSFPIATICGLSGSILNVWLGPSFVDLQPVLIILMFHLCFNLVTAAIFPLQIMANKVKLPAIATIIFGLLNILLMITLGHPKFNLGLIGIALAGGISLTLRNFIFTPIYASYSILKKSILILYPYFLQGIAAFVFVLLASICLNKLIVINNLLILLINLFVLLIIYIIFTWFVFFSASDKRFILEAITSINLQWRNVEKFNKY